VFTEKAGVNTIVVDSTDDFAGMCRNIGFSLTLYSGQMCTTPQNILVPAGGIETEAGHKSFDEVAAGIAGAVEVAHHRPGAGGRADRRHRQRRRAGPVGAGARRR
jgi:acyl-CoA reductase-like NAD-dependent aldehyde dehydrogenase